MLKFGDRVILLPGSGREGLIATFIEHTGVNTALVQFNDPSKGWRIDKEQRNARLNR